MKTQFWLSLITTTCVLPLESQAGIIGGHVSKENYPFFVVIDVDHFSCGGTLVSDNAVVTAAHCFYLPEAKRWAGNGEVSVKDSDFTSSEWIDESHTYECLRYKVHPLFRPIIDSDEDDEVDMTVHSDVAVLILKRPFVLAEGSKEVLLPCPPLDFNPQLYREGTAIGLGLTNQEPDTYATQLMEVSIKRVQDCGRQGTGGTHGINHWSQACYSIPGKAGTCMGDSGGPLVYKKQGKALCLLGIISYGSMDCQDPQFPAVFTQAGYYNNWIASQI